MTFKLYLDEDVMSSGLVQSLRLRGIDVVSVQDTHLEARTDEEQLMYATAHARVLYSFNVRHYMALHHSLLEEGHSHAGIILAEQERRYSIGEQTRRIVKIMSRMSADDMRNQVLFLSAWGSKW